MSEILDSLKLELSSGETLRWSAQPVASRQLEVFAAYLFAVPWTIFSILWTVAAGFISLKGGVLGSAMPSGVRLFFALFGLPFVAIGIWMLAKPVLVLLNAKRSIYALTDRRLMFLVTGPRKSVRSIPLTHIGPMRRRESRDGWGSLIIETHGEIDHDGDVRTQTFIVAGVPEIAKVERFLANGHGR